MWCEQPHGTNKTRKKHWPVRSGAYFRVYAGTHNEEPRVLFHLAVNHILRARCPLCLVCTAECWLERHLVMLPILYFLIYTEEYCIVYIISMMQLHRNSTQRHIQHIKNILYRENRDENERVCRAEVHLFMLNWNIFKRSEIFYIYNLVCYCCCCCRRCCRRRRRWCVCVCFIFLAPAERQSTRSRTHTSEWFSRI